MTKKNDERVRAERALKQLREVCFRFPGTTEKLSHGAPSFFVRGKMFAGFADDVHEDGRLAAWCKSSKSEQQRLVASAPERFFVPPYVGVNGWVGAVLDHPRTDWDELAIILEEGWLAVAPRTAHANPVRKPPRVVKPKTTDPAVARDALGRVTKLCEALPGSTTELRKRHATFRVRKKPYAYFLDNHDRDGRVAVAWRMAPKDNAKLAAKDPERYYIPPYIGHHGWVGLRVDVGKVDWRDVASRLAASYALITASPARRAPSKRRT